MNCSTAASRAEFALYLLPNAKAIRLVETGSLLHLLHKWTMRTCFNAQEEIYQASLEEVQQVRAAFPELGRYLGPPCYLRAGISTPICTEGSHFCGVKVWLDFPNIQPPHLILLKDLPFRSGSTAARIPDHAQGLRTCVEATDTSS